MERDGTPIADDSVPPAGTRFPLDEGGYNLPSTLQPGEDVFFVFQATVNDPLNPPGTSELVNRATVRSIAEVFLNTRDSLVQQGMLSDSQDVQCGSNKVKRAMISITRSPSRTLLPALKPAFSWTIHCRMGPAMWPIAPLSPVTDRNLSWIGLTRFPTAITTGQKTGPQTGTRTMPEAVGQQGECPDHQWIAPVDDQRFVGC